MLSLKAMLIKIRLSFTLQKFLKNLMKQLRKRLMLVLPRLLVKKSLMWNMFPLKS
jgi:hypothetical protein